MIKVGDWVTQYSKGFWQVVELKPKYADETLLTEVTTQKKGDFLGYWALLKKGFTPKMKFRIDSDVCDYLWCKAVPDDVLRSINQYFEQHPGDHQRFCDSEFVDKPAVSSAWVDLSPDQAELFERAISELPPRFTNEYAMKLFGEYGLTERFTDPPANHVFYCWHTLWDLDEDFNAVFKDPKLVPFVQK